MYSEIMVIGCMLAKRMYFVSTELGEALTQILSYIVRMLRIMWIIEAA